MKKFLAVLALVAFLGSFTAPAIAATADNVNIEMSTPDKDPKKAESKDAKKSDCAKKCSSEKKSSCGDKKTDDDKS